MEGPKPCHVWTSTYTKIVAKENCNKICLKHYNRVEINRGIWCFVAPCWLRGSCDALWLEKKRRAAFVTAIKTLKFSEKKHWEKHLINPKNQHSCAVKSCCASSSSQKIFATLRHLIGGLSFCQQFSSQIRIQSVVCDSLCFLLPLVCQGGKTGLCFLHGELVNQKIWFD